MDRAQRNKKVEDIYPLSPMQQGMLFHALLDPDSPVYSERFSYTIEGDLDIHAFRKSLDHIVASHPVCRTIFRWEGVNDPLQIVVTHKRPELQVNDLISLGKDGAAQEIADFYEADREDRFDLANAPPIRFSLFLLEKHRFHFILSYHHMLMDGWCIPLILQDLFITYLALSEGHPAPDIQRPRYRNYIEWLKTQDKKSSENYWKGLLHDFSSPTLVSADYRPALRDFSRAGKVTAALSEALTAELSDLAREMRITLSTLIQTAWAILLGRYSRQEDVVYGVTISGRPADLGGAEEMIGLFINTLPVRANLMGDRTLRDVTNDLQQQLLKIQEHGSSFLPDVQACSAVPGSVGLFNSLVIFENYPVNLDGMGEGAPVRIIDANIEEMTHYDLTLVITPGSRLDLSLGYAQDLFDHKTVSRMMKHLGTLLEGFAGAMDKPLSDAEMVGSDERELLINTFNSTDASYEKDKSIVGWFESTAADNPEAKALVFYEESLTYRQLNQKANCLSRYLRSMGAGTDVLTPILTRSPVETIVSILAVLKAGGAYLPIDPDFPEERIRYILDDSQAPVVISRKALAGRLSGYDGKVIFLDKDEKRLSGYEGGNPLYPVSPGDVAYAIYTSGSTGKPKGTLVPHQGVVNLISALHKEVYARYPGALKVAQLAAFTFDVSIQQMFASLLLGHTLYPITSEMKKDIPLLMGYILDCGVQVIDGTPSLWELLVEEGLAERPGLRLQHIIIGGEALPTGLVRRFSQGKNGKNTLWTNVYGVTESSVDSTSCLVDLDRFGDRAYAPIGKPLSNTRIYILDGEMNPVPVGVPGELYIAGDGLARGYLNNPKRTAQSFLPDPFTRGGRVYRTGDLGRWLPDGHIDFLGRMDFQVKIRGFRVETGEVAVNLSEHPEINDCVVVSREDAYGDNFLLAYYVSPEDIAVSDLKHFLGEMLPDFMIPSHFFRLDALPLNPSGKVDRKALPDPEDLSAGRESEYIAPRHQMEKDLAAIWQDILGAGQVGIRDNFFDLGGHSLKATRVISRIRRDLGVETPLRALFDHPTIEALSRVVQAHGDEELDGIEGLPKQSSYALSNAQKRLWFLEQMVPGTSTYNIPMAVTIEGELEVERFFDAFQQVVDRHESLRTFFKDEEGEPVQVIADSLTAERGWMDAAGMDDAGIAAAVSKTLFDPFDLSGLPLFRIQLFQLEEKKHLLLFVVHHIISDGWSGEVLFGEMISYYFDFLEGSTPEPEVLDIQYKEFAAWQNKLLENGGLEDQEQFWVKALAAPLPVLDLPLDRIRPAVQTHNGAAHRFGISEDLTSRLKILAQKREATPFMLLLAAFSTLLNKLSSQEDIIVGTPVAGRSRPEFEPLIGFFVNTLAIRMDITHNPSFIELLDRVKNTCLDAYSNQEYPFDQLIDILNPVRDTSTSPVFNVMFLLQDAPDPGTYRNKGAFAIQPVATDHTATKFDLTLNAVHAGEAFTFILEYNTDLFDSSSIERFAAFYENILGEIASRPETPIQEYDVISAEERRLILRTFNRTDAPYPLEKCVYQLIEEQVSKTPDAVAVSYEDQSLTYRELNQKANQLAHYLRQHGVGREKMVTLMLERSLAMEVALLGVMKSGGAYVPMGTDYPDARIDYILEDTVSPVLLTQEKFAHKVSEKNTRVICLDSHWKEIEKADTADPPALSGPGDLAYVLYTSGSTGVPKGVACIHRGLCNRLVWMQEAYGLNAEDCVLQKTPYTFDVSGWEFFWPLMAGARLHFLKPGGHKDPLHLISAIQDQGVTTLHFVPSMLGGFLQVVDDENKGQLGSLARVICSGEALMADHRDLFFRYLDCDLHNLYGPTEASIDVTYYACSAHDGSSTVPIGKPIANTQMYILNKYMKPVPLGVPGEVYIAGVNLARGYVNKPDKTAEAFIASTISKDGRLYKTGDLGRWLPDGNIEYLGRIDHQVKVRGNRIELGEVEAALSRCDRVYDCVVVDKDDGMGSRYLAAFYAAEADVPVGDLRRFLHEELPDYMVPSRFVRLNELPLSPNGKVDRKALPDVDAARPEMEREYVEPRDEMETQLASVWQDVLGVDKVGIYDNFFDLGGHSLLIMKVLARLKLLYPVTVQDFFDHQTIADLGDIISQRIAAGDESVQGLMVEEDTDAAVPVDIPISGQKEHPGGILLTGATGYLGAYLLKTFLEQTDARIYCLVRGKGLDHITQRLKAALEFYFGGREVLYSRILPIQGDIGIDGLQLDGDAEEKIVNEVDTIVHAAADVRHFGEYAQFENINVLGTKRVLALAESGKCRRFHYVSTLSVSGDYIPNRSKALFKETDFNRGQVLENVYARSKYAAEELVRASMANGLQATIYRVGNLVGTWETGKFQRSIDTSAFYGFMKAIAVMGLVPEIQSDMDMTPVDTCSAAITRLMLFPETMNQTLHLFNPHLVPLNELAEKFRSFGYGMKVLSAADYMDILDQYQKGEVPGEAFEKLVPLVAGSLSPQTKIIYDSSVAKHFLEAAKFKWPIPDSGFIHKLIAYCVSIGFMAPPESSK